MSKLSLIRENLCSRASRHTTLLFEMVAWIPHIKSGVGIVSYGNIASKTPCLATLNGADWRSSMDEKTKEVKDG